MKKILDLKNLRPVSLHSKLLLLEMVYMIKYEKEKDKTGKMRRKRKNRDDKGKSEVKEAE
jgi:hypothetical protein